MARISEEFDSVKSLLYKVLEKYPETRDNDTLLYIKCCKILGAETLDDAMALPINVISIHKMRQVIQNKEGLFPPTNEVKAERMHRAEEARRYFSGN